MSETHPIAVIGATGLIGRNVIEAGVGRNDFRLAALARREARLPDGARMEMVVAPPENWGALLGRMEPRALICALGTTWKKAGSDEETFRAIDQELVLKVAEEAAQGGVERFAYVSSIGANPHGKSLYLKVKGETERALGKLGFKRLDILRPGLLRGPRDGDLRPAEQLGKMLSPLADLALHGGMRDYRSIAADEVARALLHFAMSKPRGKFTHTHDQIRRAARDFDKAGHSDVG